MRESMIKQATWTAARLILIILAICSCGLSIKMLINSSAYTVLIVVGCALSLVVTVAVLTILVGTFFKTPQP